MNKLTGLILVLVFTMACTVEAEESKLGRSGSASGEYNIVQIAKRIIANSAALFGIGPEYQAKRCHIAPASQPPAQLGSYGLIPPRSEPSKQGMNELLQENSK